MALRIPLSLIVLLLLGAPSFGAELFYMDHDAFTENYVGPVGPLVISGDIEPGDYDHLLAKIHDDQDRFFSQNKILLASDGGDVTEAIKIGKLVRSLFSHVVVGTQTGRCVSACFLIYAAAQQRGTEGERLIGINRPYLADATSASAAAIDADPAAGFALADNDSLKQVRDFLVENEVPTYLIEEMFRHAYDDAYWLSTEDEKKLGYRSKALNRYLTEKCGWDESLERDVYSGKRPLNDLTLMWKCRADATGPDARKALAMATDEKLPKAKSAKAKSKTAKTKLPNS